MPPSNGVPVYMARVRVRETKSEGEKTFARQFSGGFRLRDTTTREKVNTQISRVVSLSVSLSLARGREQRRRETETRKQNDSNERRVRRNKTRTFRAVQGEMPLENIILQRFRPRGERVRVFGFHLRFCFRELFHLLRDATDGGVVRRRGRSGGGHRV